MKRLYHLFIRIRSLLLYRPIKCIGILLILLPLKFNAQSSNDSLAVIQLLQKEGLTWRLGDREGHAACWQERPYSKILIATKDGNMLDIPVSAIINPSDDMIGGGGFAVHTNHKMALYDTNGWVSHDEVSIDKFGKETHSYEMRMLEKISGNWKLVGQTGLFFDAKKEGAKIDTTSYVHTVDINTGLIETPLVTKEHFEAPNWHPDGYLILNSKGKLHTLDLTTKELKILNTGFADRNNNDHVISPDLKWLGISHVDDADPSPKAYKSKVYYLPIEGGEPIQVTTEVMSFLHGWTPDSKTVAYTGERNGNFDIYTMDIRGGKEKRLTRTKGLDDGPDYSPDGKYIYLNSYRTGHMQIWRMRANGSKPEQLTFDENSNWFPHPSPDGKWIVYIAYMSDQKEAHLFGKQVKLRLMNLETKEITDLTPEFFGGQGTINVPSWSPDSKKVAFVSYSLN
ncbi:TolB family protein [Maribacter sp. CXY002]|uniref:TolB family protein n=1 Tax=Maribacter luteocoastalis TaxID=3407671 RepID=UPI003B6719C4